MLNEAMIPLEYCTPSRAARLLGCEVEDIFHFYEIGAIKIYLKLDEDGEWPYGGEGFICNDILIDEPVNGSVCYQGEFGTVDSERVTFENGSLFKYGRDVVFCLDDCAEDEDDESYEPGCHLWARLERFDNVEINLNSTEKERAKLIRKVRDYDFVSFRVWLSGFHEVLIPYSFLRKGFQHGFNNLEETLRVSIVINTHGKIIQIYSAEIKDVHTLFRVYTKDLREIKACINSGLPIGVKESPSKKDLIYSRDAKLESGRVTSKQCRFIVDMLKSYGFGDEDFKGSISELRMKISNRIPSVGDPDIDDKTIADWLKRAGVR
ncbi:hypothetical protein [Aeromonas sp. s5]|uniref:hypothetical protein n=1 Tax=Aeromonas sp. s5 TaxID=3138487 RepID=UPI0034A2C7A8